MPGPTQTNLPTHELCAALPPGAWLAYLRQTAPHDLPAARRAALLRLIWQEAYLTRPGLIVRIEAILGPGCFGASPQAAFRRDLALVRRALAEAGYHLRYSRRPGQPGYYLEGQPPLAEHLQRLIAGAVAEVDPAQLAIYRRLKPSHRIAQLAHLSDWLWRVNQRRLEYRKVA